MAKSIFSVSLTAEISAKFDREINKSALVERLLTEYYKISPVQIEELKQEVSQKASILSELQEQEINKEQKKREKEMRAREIEEQAEIQLKRMFRDELGRDITEEEFSTYKELFEEELTDFWKYCGGLKNVTK